MEIMKPVKLIVGGQPPIYPPGLVPDSVMVKNLAALLWQDSITLIYCQYVMKTTMWLSTLKLALYTIDL